MKKGKSLMATGILTVLILATLLTATLATPILAATNQPTTSKMSISDDLKKILDEILNEIQQGKIVTSYLSMKFAERCDETLNVLPKWNITPRNLGFEFSINLAHIIEFNYSDNDKSLSSNDTILRKIELEKINWGIIYDVKEIENRVIVTLTGTYNESGQKILCLTVRIYVYLKDTNVTGPKYWAVVPGLRAVKIDIVINKYEWVDGSGASKLALVMVLKCHQFEKEYEYRYRLANGTTFSDEDAMSGFIFRADRDEDESGEDESEIGLVRATNEHEVRARFRWFNYALRLDTQEEVIGVTSYFNVTGDGIELQLCVDHFGNSSVSFDPYFEVLSVEKGLPATGTILLLLQYQYAVRSGQVVALAGATMLLVAGVAAALYLRKRH